jgi:shikimate 5-dehydrogenase
MNLEKVTRPTMYFVGVTTGKSSIMKVFPEWAEALGIDAQIKGIDIAIHERPDVYREVAQFMKDDPLSLGALVTTHKIDMMEACRDIFDYVDPCADRFGELSCISKGGHGFAAHAKDPITCGMAMEEFLPAGHWARNPEAGVFIMGAGGSAISMCSHFMRPEFANNRPAEIVVANRSKPRLDEIERLCAEMNPAKIACSFHLTPEPGQNDEVLKSMKPGSLIVNATGLGKDRPGSPLTDAALFPERVIVWEINYRGDLLFIHQAEAQAEPRKLKVEDGWMYFIYGWTQVMAEVFHMPIRGELLKKLDGIAARHSGRSA